MYLKLLFFISAFSIVSCSVEEYDSSIDRDLDSDLRITAEATATLTDYESGENSDGVLRTPYQPSQAYLDITYSYLWFFAYLTEDGIKEFNTRQAAMLQVIDDVTQYSFDDLADFYEDFHEVPRNVTLNYLNLLQTHQSLLSQPSADSELENALLWVIYENATNKWVFGLITAVLDAAGVHVPCELEFAASFGDAVISGAATIISAPTGIGLAFGAASTASAYGVMVATGVDCFS